MIRERKHLSGMRDSRGINLGFSKERGRREKVGFQACCDGEERRRWLRFRFRVEARKKKEIRGMGRRKQTFGEGLAASNGSGHWDEGGSWRFTGEKEDDALEERDGRRCWAKRRRRGNDAVLSMGIHGIYSCGSQFRAYISIFLSDTPPRRASGRGRGRGRPPLQRLPHPLPEDAEEESSVHSSPTNENLNVDPPPPPQWQQVPPPPCSPYEAFMDWRQRFETQIPQYEAAQPPVGQGQYVPPPPPVYGGGPVTWEDFLSEFNKEYYSKFEKGRISGEFLALKQRDMSVNTSRTVPYSHLVDTAKQAELVSQATRKTKQKSGFFSRFFKGKGKRQDSDSSNCHNDHDGPCPLPAKCFQCGSRDHLRRDCPYWQGTQTQASRGGRNFNSGRYTTAAHIASGREASGSGFNTRDRVQTRLYTMTREAAQDNLNSITALICKLWVRSICGYTTVPVIPGIDCPNALWGKLVKD
ncbi:Zinc finger, CCHC-type [Corchorus olitorius]|uniref:Zinc finger, CCHC-type n=1 Tax=Corchorus olitorius TaxID=93759 RepID=A0A1R3HL75_9ROSI|nr:Zinc finger, CCHC-type [Corchorus olitorius]